MIQPLVISGPSGVGKSFLADYLVQNFPFKQVPSTTTRLPRSGEVNMLQNEFLTDEEFEKVKESGDLLLYIEILGAKYGYRESIVESIMKQGLIPISIMFTSDIGLWFKKYPDSFGVYLLPTNEKLLEDRLRTRGDSDETISRRMSSTIEEIRSYKEDVKDFYKICIEITDDEDVKKAIEEIKSHYNF
jgi:guanylate kinase